MIFTGIKRKSHQIFFNKKLNDFIQKFAKKNSEKIENVIVFVDDLEEVGELSKELCGKLKIKNNNLNFLIFQDKNDKQNEDIRLFTSRDFGWYGSVKSPHLKSFLTKRYDLLINYSKVENVYVNTLILQCNSGFRIGFPHLNNELYDLIIDCDLKNKNLINKEIQKYLTILNKL